MSLNIHSPAHAQNVYRISSDGSLWVTFSSGMEVTLTTEPHVPSDVASGASAGIVHPTVGRCNITLPGEHSHSLIEWRQRREQAKGNYTAYERRLRVTSATHINCCWVPGQCHICQSIKSCEEF